jgi:hypothetical protein
MQLFHCFTSLFARIALKASRFLHVSHRHAVRRRIAAVNPLTPVYRETSLQGDRASLGLARDARTVPEGQRSAQSLASDLSFVFRRSAKKTPTVRRKVGGWGALQRHVSAVTL